MGLYRNENSVSYFLDPPAKHFPLVNCCQPAAMLTVLYDKVVENIYYYYSHIILHKRNHMQQRIYTDGKMQFAVAGFVCLYTPPPRSKRGMTLYLFTLMGFISCIVVTASTLNPEMFAHLGTIHGLLLSSM